MGSFFFALTPPTAPPSWRDFVICCSTTGNACPVHSSSSAKREPVFGGYSLLALGPVCPRVLPGGAWQQEGRAEGQAGGAGRCRPQELAPRQGPVPGRERKRFAEQ